jgi:acetyltransferase-like isoleucine patch superfamily enzyme
MNLISNIFKSIYIKILLKGSFKRRIKYLRKQGVKIGQNCIINSLSFSSEPYLVEIGHEARISSDTQFITHDASVHTFLEDSEGEIYGRIIIGNNVFIGNNCIILLNTIIGDNCIIGAGSVVRGKFPDNSVIIGNPAKVVSSINIQKMIFCNKSKLLQTRTLNPIEKKGRIKKHFGLN